ncbi:MAG: CDP-glucose 4,6-dehydratase [Vicingaceae bacterium]
MQNLLRESYQGKKVFLTGHTGFKGSWLAFILNHLGAEIKGYSLDPVHPVDLYNLLGIENFSNSVIADIRHYENLEKEILEFQPDYVFHLAAQSLVLRSYKEPSLTYQTNVMGTVNILESLRKYSGKCNAIIVTTDKVYENIEQEYHYRESDKLGGFDPYSSSKAACEIAVSSYRQSFFNPHNYGTHEKSIASARSGNVIGGGDWSENRIIPDLIRAIESQESLEIRNPGSVRPWQHLLDPLYGYLLLGARMEEDPIKYAQAYNFGPIESESITVEGLVKRSIEIFGKGDYFTSDIHPKNHEAKLLHLDVSKAQKELLWNPKINAEKAIALTIEWYKEYNNDPAGITFKQISEYLNRLD